MKLLRKTKRDYYSNLGEKSVTDNKKFWKTVKPSLSNKTLKLPHITLVEKDEIIRDETVIAETFNTFFTNIVSNLKITPYFDSGFKEDLINADEAIMAIAEKYEKHPSIIKIKNFTQNKFQRK